MKKTLVSFDQALSIALERMKQASKISNDITLVRDIHGRMRLLLPGRKDSYKAKMRDVKALSRDLSKSLGEYGFPPEGMIIYTDDLGIEISAAEGRIIQKGDNFQVRLLDRQITGQDWMKGTWERASKNPRVTFFGVKGGVGRSTALIIWAWHLAKIGNRVLVFDLDLESPGASSTLLPNDVLPDFGIVDWFVEDAVGQSEMVEKEMRAKSPLASTLPGEIIVVPAYGSKTGDYMPKLARCYNPEALSNEGWGRRLERLVAGIEEIEDPDIVILDSRAGIHDIAAAAVTRMDAQTFLFAVESRQTWRAYAFLFESWKDHPQVRNLREHLQIVASMVPETGREEYLKRFRDRSWDLFRDHLYDEEAPGAVDAFNFDRDDPDGPHYPMPIFWHRALMEFDPTGSFAEIEKKTADEALGIFMERADRLIAPKEEVQK